MFIDGYSLFDIINKQDSDRFIQRHFLFVIVYFFRKPFDKILTIFIVTEYLPTFYSPNHDMVQNAGSIKSCCSMHIFL